jgi:hypothetical protein
MSSNAAEFAVNHRHEPVEGILLAKLYVGKKPRNFSASLGHTANLIWQHVIDNAPSAIAAV